MIFDKGEYTNFIEIDDKLLQNSIGIGVVIQEDYIRVDVMDIRHLEITLYEDVI